MNHIPLKAVRLKNHSAVDEAWLQKLLAEHPALLGLGDDLRLIDKERRLPGGGRLDLLFQADRDDEAPHRYEVEIQLGETDPSHIIRSLEYWDLERSRYPKYKHTLVLVAEDITGRFLNVIRLFNGFIPVIALRMKAFEAVGGISLDFSKVISPIEIGLEEEDELAGVTTPATREDWERRASPATVKMAENAIALCADFGPKLTPNFNNSYIGILREGRAWNFAHFKPRKRQLVLHADTARTDDRDAELTRAGLDFDYLSAAERYRVWLAEGDLEKHRAIIVALLKDAYASHRNG